LSGPDLLTSGADDPATDRWSLQQFLFGTLSIWTRD
jgi:hypothetical protein